jgi:hypothetical protein
MKLNQEEWSKTSIALQKVDAEQGKEIVETVEAWIAHMEEQMGDGKLTREIIESFLDDEANQIVDIDTLLEVLFYIVTMWEDELGSEFFQLQGSISQRMITLVIVEKLVYLNHSASREPSKPS